MFVFQRYAAQLRWVGRVLVLACAYYFTAKLVSYLTLAPGFATSVWPPAGVALAALLIYGLSYWPGIFLGAFYLNAHMHWGDWPMVSSAIWLGVGCSLQAIVGYMAVRATIKLPTALEQAKEILAVVIFGGIFACTISPTIGVATHFLAGHIQPSALGSNWITWWVGDAIGVVIFTPLLLLAFASREMVSPLRKGMMAFLLLSTFAITVYLFYAAKEADQQNRHTEFERLVNGISDNIRYTFDGYLNILAYTEGLFTASDDVTDADFTHFTNIIFARRPEITAILWAPAVKASERAQYELDMQKVQGNFTILQMSPDSDAYQKAGDRDIYFPVTYAGHSDSSSFAFGNDLYFKGTANGRVRFEAMVEAARTGQAQLGGRVVLHAPGNPYGLIAVEPVFSRAAENQPSAGRELQGYIVGYFAMPRIMQLWEQTISRAGVALQIRDITDRNAPVELYNSRTPDRKEVAGDQKEANASLLGLNKRFALDGRLWELSFTEDNSVAEVLHNWTMWMVLIGGMIFTSILSAFMLMVSGRAQAVQRLVEAKTQEVAAGHDRLKQANLELQRQYTIVKEKEETFRMAMENASTGMALVAPTGTFRNVNQALCDMLGYTMDELLTRDFQSVTHPDDHELDAKYQRQLLTGEIRNCRFEKRYLHKSGRPVWVLLSVSMVRAADNRPLYFIVQVHDITELKEADLKRQQLIDKLIASNTELEKFAYVASHDMQEPLRMMASFSQLLAQENRNRLSDDGRQYLKLITNSSRRMQSMVGDLLEYARLSGQASPLEVVDAGLELEHVRDNLTAIITRTQAVITSDRLPKVQANAVQFASLLQNLIANALKYQMAGSQPSIHVSSSRPDAEGMIEFTIRDNGIGIAASDLERIFEPFMRLHPWQQYQGTGIGLAICRRIVEGHGGRIWATSEPGVGSVFHFTVRKA